MLIVDAHEDLAWNMQCFQRDYTRSAHETRRLEAGGTTPQRNDDSLLGYPEYRRGRVAAVFATLFAAPARFAEGDWDKLVYSDFNQAHRLYQQQIDRYLRLCDDAPQAFRLLQTRGDLDETIAAWEAAPDWPPAPAPAVVAENAERAERGYAPAGPDPHSAPPAASPDGPPVGLLISMEGAEGVRDPGELDEWYQRGVRAIGPAWVGTRFCGGSREPGPMTGAGFALLERMAELNMALDLTHMDEQAVLQALDAYPGVIWASHSNALALLPNASGNRHLSNRVLHGLLERDGVVGVVFYNAFLKVGWRKGDRRDEVSLAHVAAQIDTICQMAGDARHVGIGTDFDGGFGWQSVPHEIDTIADLQKLTPLLAEKGYTEADIRAIMGGNWLGALRRILPESL